MRGLFSFYTFRRDDITPEDHNDSRVKIYISGKQFDPKVYSYYSSSYTVYVFKPMKAGIAMGTGEIRGDHQILRRPLGMPRELLQFAAMLTMLIDHIGAVLFPEQIILRMIGRIAFPLYAFGIVQGFIYTSDIKRYIKRLGILALISQIPFMLAFHYWEINVIGTLFICICTLFLLEKAQSKVKRIIMLVISWLILQWIPTDYGTYALLLIFIYRYAAHKAILLHFLLNTYYLLTVGVWYQFFSMVSSVWLSMGEAKSRIGSWSIPRWLWISFYPVHLTLLAFIKWLLF